MDRERDQIHREIYNRERDLHRGIYNRERDRNRNGSIQDTSEPTRKKKKKKKKKKHRKFASDSDESETDGKSSDSENESRTWKPSKKKVRAVVETALKMQQQQLQTILLAHSQLQAPLPQLQAPMLQFPPRYTLYSVPDVRSLSPKKLRSLQQGTGQEVISGYVM